MIFLNTRIARWHMYWYNFHHEDDTSLRNSFVCGGNCSSSSCFLNGEWWLHEFKDFCLCVCRSFRFRNIQRHKSYCSTVHFRRITSIYQPTNAHIISHKTQLKHFKNTLKHSEMFRSCQIIIRELCSFLKFYYSIHNSIRICKRGVVAAYHVVLWSSG